MSRPQKTARETVKNDGSTREIGDKDMNADEQTTIIEINGVKLEVDLRTARRIDTLRIGDRVKCLLKEYQSWKTVPGVVVGFEPFRNLPSIVVCYLDAGYTPDLHFKSFNSETTDFEIVPDLDQNALEINREHVLARMETEAEKKRGELREIEQKRVFFLANFGRYFSDKNEG